MPKKFEKCLRKTSNVDVFIQEKTRLVLRTESYNFDDIKKQLSTQEQIIFNKYFAICEIEIKNLKHF